MGIGNDIKRWLGLDRFSFDSILIKKELIQNIMNLANNAYPNEFMALLSGKIEKSQLIISSLLMQQTKVSNKGAQMDTWSIPMTSDAVGSVHSHPSLSNKPSVQDLQFFNKHPGVHIIICKPFTKRDIKVYNSYGREMELKLE